MGVQGMIIDRDMLILGNIFHPMDLFQIEVQILRKDSEAIEGEKAPLYLSSEETTAGTKFCISFQPGNNEGKTEIFPGLKRAPHKISHTYEKFSGDKIVTLGKFPLKNIKEVNYNSWEKDPMNQIEYLGREYKFRIQNLRILWGKLGIDEDFMEIMSRHLKIGEISEYLPLNDLSLEAYKKLHNFWFKYPENFLRGIKVCVSFMGPEESMRRLKTLANQIYEHTIVANWILIKKHLISTNQLNQEQAEEIGRIYRLSERFPPISNKSEKDELHLQYERFNEEDQQDKLKWNKKTEFNIVASLGIIDSKRQESSDIDDFSTLENSKIWKFRDDLYLSSIYNGVDIRKVVSAAKKIEFDPNVNIHHQINYQDVIQGDKFERLNEISLVPWCISPERKWLIKLYGNEKQD
jgi:hypothetical protein